MRRITANPAFRSAAIGLVVPFLLLCFWELNGWRGWMRPNLLPPPSAVVSTVIELARRGELWGHIETTLLRVLFGFVIGTAVATALGALTGYSILWRRLLDPMLQALRSIPSIAWVPLFILWLGIFEAAKVTLIAVGVFFPVYLNLMAGIEAVDRRLLEVGRVYRFLSPVEAGGSARVFPRGVGAGRQVGRDAPNPKTSLRGDAVSALG